MFLLPFMLYGAFVFFRDQTTRNKIIFATWILASPLPAAITKDGATYLLRVATLMPFLTYFCALGIVESFNLIKKNWRIPYGLLVTLIALYSSYYYFYGYFHVYPALSANSFEFGFKELADFQTKNPGKMFIVWDDKYPYTHFCFWQNLPLTTCQPDNTNTRVFVNKSRVDLSLPTVFFSLPNSLADLELIINQYQPKFFVLPGKYQKEFSSYAQKYKSIKTIKNPDLTTAFEIYQLN